MTPLIELGLFLRVNMLAAFHKRALRQARLRDIFMDQEGIVVRNVSPPAYTEEPPTPPPCYVMLYSVAVLGCSC